LIVLSGCHQKAEFIRTCHKPVTWTRGDAGELTMFAYPFGDAWPSGRMPAAAVGDVIYRFDRSEECPGGERTVGLDALVNAELTPASLGTVGQGRRMIDSIELPVTFAQAGEGTLAVTVLTENDDEVTDRIAVRVRDAADFAMEIKSEWAMQGDAYAREPQLAGTQWETGRVWRTAADGEVLSGELVEGSKTNVIALSYYSRDSGQGRIELAAGTGTFRMVAMTTPEIAPSLPLEVLAKTAITASTMTAGTSCSASSGGQAEITMHAGARLVRGGAFAVTSSAPNIVHVVGSGYDPEVAPYNCLAQGTATLTLDLPNAPQMKTITVQ